MPGMNLVVNRYLFMLFIRTVQKSLENPSTNWLFIFAGNLVMTLCSIPKTRTKNMKKTVLLFGPIPTK